MILRRRSRNARIGINLPLGCRYVARVKSKKTNQGQNDRAEPQCQMAMPHRPAILESKRNCGLYISDPLGPVSLPPFSMNSRNRSRSPSTSLKGMPSTSPAFSNNPSASYSIVKVTRVRETSSASKVTAPLFGVPPTLCHAILSLGTCSEISTSHCFSGASNFRFPKELV